MTMPMTTSRRRSWRTSLLASAIGLGLVVTSWAGVPGSADAKGGKKKFVGSYDGDFVMLFGAGPGGTHVLSFAGDGKAKKVGKSDILGNSVLTPISPVCMEIVQDSITIVSKKKDDRVLHIVASGVDCLDFSDPNQLRIVGDGTITISEQEDLDDYTGDGTFEVVADVLSQAPGTASGTFHLTFEGKLKKQEQPDDDDGGYGDDDDGGCDDD